eukprot:6339154-Alexandrium_andersonii.AAC.1
MPTKSPEKCEGLADAVGADGGAVLADVGQARAAPHPGDEAAAPTQGCGGAKADRRGGRTWSPSGRP